MRIARIAGTIGPSISRWLHALTGWRVERVQTGPTEVFKFYINRTSKVRFVSWSDSRYFITCVFGVDGRRWREMEQVARGYGVPDRPAWFAEKYDLERKVFQIQTEDGVAPLEFEKVSAACDVIQEIEARTIK